MFEIKNKIALVTGGCGGIGIAFAKALLERGAKGVVLADINVEIGMKLEDEYLKKCGSNKLIFIPTDVSRFESLKSTINKTIEKYKQLDIVFNNAGVLDETNIEKTININLVGVLNGCNIARDLLFKNKIGPEAVIVNTASVLGILPVEFMSIYGASKAAIIHYSRAIAIPENYDKYKTKIITICPGGTDTEILSEKLTAKSFNPEDLIKYNELMKNMTLQTPSTLASAVMEIIEEAENGSIWVVDQGKKELINYSNFWEFPPTE